MTAPHNRDTAPTLADLSRRIAVTVRHVASYGLGDIPAEQVATSVLSDVVLLTPEREAELRREGWRACAHEMLLGDGHVYLSTACHHGEHAYCKAVVNPAGVRKVPATCKFCSAQCICPCHEQATSEETPTHG